MPTRLGHRRVRDYTAGPKVIDAHVRQTMKGLLKDIQDGTWRRTGSSRTRPVGRTSTRCAGQTRDELETVGRSSGR